MKAESKLDLDIAQLLSIALCTWKRPLILEIKFESDCGVLPHNDSKFDFSKIARSRKPLVSYLL